MSVPWTVFHGFLLFLTVFQLDFFKTVLSVFTIFTVFNNFHHFKQFITVFMIYFCIHDTIPTRPEIQFLPYAGFFNILIKFNLKKKPQMCPKKIANFLFLLFLNGLICYMLNTSMFSLGFIAFFQNKERKKSSLLDNYYNNKN